MSVSWRACALTREALCELRTDFLPDTMVGVFIVLRKARSN